MHEIVRDRKANLTPFTERRCFSSSVSILLIRSHDVLGIVASGVAYAYHPCDFAWFLICSIICGDNW
jgi:hypothetical protein